MSFTLQISDRTNIEAMFTFLAAITDDVLLEFQSNGIRCKTMDKQQIALIDLSINKDTFTEYTGSFPALVGLNTGYILKALKSGNKDDLLTVMYPGSDIIKLSFSNVQRKFDVCLNLIEVSAFEGNVSVPDNTMSVLFPTELFVTSIHNLAIFSEDIRVCYTNDALTFEVPSVVSNDFSGTSISFNGIQITGNRVESKELFIIKYLDLYSKMAKMVFFDLRMYVRPNAPLVLRADNNFMAVSLYIAPKLDQDQD